ncbi:hypothetical protein CYMTET_37259 [Cymbomonas tetramitiformis]|uniref:Uncharacterized protein n=1 Tax=Cymbomonas tetramitiformis TaxID=36881 RepID=A0AAE0F657_9CHLO|nr:hypothetical protein CYMTET_37259 [Cymbomonas tetramitiformis]
MKTSVMAWFRRSSICSTVCNDDPRKSILVMNQRTGSYMILKIMILDTGSMLFVMNQTLVTLLGLVTTLRKANIDTGLGSQGTQQHRQWSPGEIMLVICPGTTNEMVLAADGISPCSAVNFDVLLSVDVLHAMSAGILPATPHRDAALVFHPHNQQGDFDTKAYIPIRTLKTSDHNNGSHFIATPSWNEPVTPSAQHHQAPPKARWGALFRVAWAAIAISSLLQPAAGALIEVDEAHVSPMNTLPVVALLWGWSPCSSASAASPSSDAGRPDKRYHTRRQQHPIVSPHRLRLPATPATPYMQEQNQPHLSVDTVQNIFDTLSRTHRGPANQENLRPVPAQATTRQTRRTRPRTFA